MNNNVLIQKMKQEIDSLKVKNTPTIRNLSKRYFKIVANKPSDEIFALCEDLLETKLWSHQIIAYDWAYRLKSYYTTDTFTMFENWLYTYVKDWYDCDDFCCHAFGYLLYKYPKLATKVSSWTKSDNFAVRRSAAVVFIYSARRGQLPDLIPWEIIKILMHDKHYLVLKGYGWLLKEMTKNYKTETIQFLQKYEAIMPRLSFRYAIEKLTNDEKNNYF